MAHLAKYKRTAVGNMLHHYRRDRDAVKSRRNIDEKRTHLNYVIGNDIDYFAAIERLAGIHNANGRFMRADAVVMADWVVTMPGNCPEDRQRDFFEAAFGFIQEQYGAENVPCGFVHLDETTPHMHVTFFPFDREKGRFTASSILTKKHLNAFHGRMQKHVDAAMGIHVDVTLDDEKKTEKAVRYASLDEFQRASDAIRMLQEQEREAAERLERHRRKVREAEEEERRLAIECRSLEVESREVERELAEVIREGEEAETRIARLEGYAVGCERGTERLGDRVVGLLMDAAKSIALSGHGISGAADLLRKVKERVDDLMRSWGFGAAPDRIPTVVAEYRNGSSRSVLVQNPKSIATRKH